MDRYQVSENENGPWLELTVTNNPVHALARGRASFAWPVVWVAKMRPIRGADILPSQEIMFSEMEELISDRYGSSVVDILHEALGAEAYRQIEVALTGHLLDEEVDVLVPEIKKPYGRDQAVRPVDFLPQEPKPPVPRKPSLKELLIEKLGPLE